MVEVEEALQSKVVGMALVQIEVAYGDAFFFHMEEVAFALNFVCRP